MLADRVSEVVYDMKDILEACDAKVLSENYAEAMIWSWGGEAVSALLRPLQSPPVSSLEYDTNLRLNDMGLSPE